MTEKERPAVTQPVDDCIRTLPRGNGLNRSHPVGDVAYGSGDRLA